MLRFKKEDGSSYPDWDEVRIKDVFDIQKGASLSKADISEDGTPFILYGELYTTYGEVATEIQRKTNKEVDKKYYSQIGDVIIPTSGESPVEISTATCVMKDDVILAGDLNIYRSNEVDGRYFSYLMNHNKKYDVARIAQGAAIVHVQASEIGKIKIPVPCMEEQRKIADSLSVIDEKISIQESVIVDLEELKKGTVQKIFDQEIRFKDDNGEEFPEWEEKTIDEIAFVIGGGTPSTSKKEFWEGTIPWVSSSDLIEHNINYISQTRFITEEAIAKSATKLISKGSILIVSRVGIGKVAIANRDLCTSQDFTNLTQLKDNSVFLAYAVQKRIKEELKNIQGTTIKGIPSKNIKEYFILMPCLEEQNKIADCLSALDRKIEIEKKVLEDWKQIKKALLQQMFV